MKNTITDHNEDKINSLRLANKEIDLLICNLEAKGIDSEVLELALSLYIIEYLGKNKENSVSTHHVM